MISAKIVKFLINLLPSRKLRHKYRDKYFPKTSIIENYGENNKLILFDDSGNETDLKYINNLSVKFLGNNNVIRLYYKLRLGIPTLITCTENNVVSIGKSKFCMFISFSELPLSNNTELHIGENFECGLTVFRLHRESNLKVTIGDDCMFSSNIYIKPSDGHTIIDKNTNKIINYPQSINIGNHCWLGRDAVVLKGGGIPDNSIIGIRSVYTRSSNPKDQTNWNGGIFAGNPAKIIKTNVTWDRNDTQGNP